MARRFNSAALKAISQAPATGKAEWLIAAEDSVAFLTHEFGLACLVDAVDGKDVRGEIDADVDNGLWTSPS